MWETNRITLRPFEKQDAPQICRIINEDEIRRAMVTVKYPFSETAASEFIERSNAEHTKRFAVLEANRDEILGCVSLLEIDETHLQAELSFFISAKASGKGLTTEAGKLVLRFGFFSLGLNRIYALHLMSNAGSAKVLEKLGFKGEGVLRERVKKNDDFYDVKMLSLLKREFAA